MDVEAGSAGLRTKKRNKKMTFSLNRILDSLVSIAIVGLTVTLAGATAVLGA